MDKQAFHSGESVHSIGGESCSHSLVVGRHVKYAADADYGYRQRLRMSLLHTDQHHMLHRANEIVRAFSELIRKPPVPSAASSH